MNLSKCIFSKFQHNPDQPDDDEEPSVLSILNTRNVSARYEAKLDLLGRTRRESGGFTARSELRRSSRDQTLKE